MNIAVPNLPSADLAVSRPFYVETLGFKIQYDTSEGGTSGLLLLERDGMRINIDSPMDGHGRQACVSLEVEDIDSLYAEWASKIPDLRPPVEEAWGARTFGFQDPDHNTIFVIQGT